MAKASKGESSAEREARVSGVVARWIDEQGLDADRVLVVDDDDGGVFRAVKQAGAVPVLWHRHAHGNRKAAPWPDADPPADLAVLRLGRDWANFELQLHAVLSQLRPGGRLWVVGANDEGVKSAPKRMAPLLPTVETLWIKHRVRILEAVRPDGLDLRDQLTDWREQVTLDLPGAGAHTLVSYPGLFAHGRLDDGTAMLLQHLPQVAAGSRVLDFGCGAGAISLAVAAASPGARLFACDVDALAVHAARQNLPQAQVFLGDGWGAIELGARFDLVLSNPPLHRGHAQDPAALDAFVTQAPMRLNGGGRLIMVTWRSSPALRVLGQHFDKVDTLAVDARFQVLSAR